MKGLRTSLAAIVIVLIAIGVIMIYSASGVYALSERGDAAYFLKRHLLFLLIGFVMTLGVMAVDYHVWQKWARPLLLTVMGLLAVVLVPGLGHASFGARRWFNLGPFHFQPSELAKLAVIMYTADFLSRKGNHVHRFTRGFLPVILLLGVVCVLIVKQPDLGSALLIASVVLIMLFVAGARWAHLIALGALTMPVVYFLVVKVPYRMRRITAFLDPWQDSQGAGFQLSQSQIALGSGGVYGVGLGKSVQKMFYLPAAHTDFILSIIGEELGLLGTLAVILLFMMFIWQGARVVKRTGDPFGYYLGLGLVILVGLQAVINIGVSIGAFPTKGLPLPFISYGGSALVFNMVAVGLLLNISRMEDR